MTVQTAERSAYVSLRDAARILDVSPQVVVRLVRAGRVGVRTLPVRDKYCVADLERLARESVRSASK